MYLHPTKGYRGSFTVPRGTNKRRRVIEAGLKFIKRARVSRNGY